MKDQHQFIAQLQNELQDLKSEYEAFKISHEKDIAEDKQTATALIKRLEELQHLYDLLIGSEMRMIDIKHEVNQLLKELGREEKYTIHN